MFRFGDEGENDCTKIKSQFREANLLQQILTTLSKLGILSYDLSKKSTVLNRWDSIVGGFYLGIFKENESSISSSFEYSISRLVVKYVMNWVELV